MSATGRVGTYPIIGMGDARISLMIPRMTVANPPRVSNWRITTCAYSSCAFFKPRAKKILGGGGGPDGSFDS